MRPSSNAPSRIKRRRRQVLLRIKEVDGSSNAVVVFSETRGARDEVLVVPPEYYRNQCKIEELYQKGVGIGRDGAFITGDDWVFDSEHRKVFHLDYCSGCHTLVFDDGVRSLAPTFLTHPSSPDGDDDEYVFAFNLLLLAGKGGALVTDLKVDAMLALDPMRRWTRVGRVAKALKSWILGFRRRRL